MPRYVYVCSKCKEYFESSHSYKHKVTDCDICGEKNCVSKFLGTPINLKNKNINKRKNVGSVVEETIKDVKNEIEEQKKKLRKVKK